ncbi:hypothetical protein PoB_003389400 [Plakobranchus ocellatus]|uniref:Uncharacterized protein n=1 Tax=Plakobranchus ocellatus TaxID=259542 RepID=A0AAV4ALZ7_9GAST|nr:hypothetical protein PoB_003389400 [Plakobranchus ocellatus]
MDHSPRRPDGEKDARPRMPVLYIRVYHTLPVAISPNMDHSPRRPGGVQAMRKMPGPACPPNAHDQDYDDQRDEHAQDNLTLISIGAE